MRFIVNPTVTASPINYIEVIAVKKWVRNCCAMWGLQHKRPGQAARQCPTKTILLQPGRLPVQGSLEGGFSGLGNYD
jgi:hypothetical protein